jgi:glycosyltransferase involved in cell wall biosynthesis
VKVLWHSVSPLTPSGYGQQTALFAPRLNRRDDIDLAISSGYGINTGFDFDGVKVYPGDDWNKHVLGWREKHAAGEPILTITLMDVWPLDQEMFRHIADTGGLACWVPVDHDPVTPGVGMFLGTTGATPVAMSRFGERALRDAGFDPLYAPHGVETSVFRPAEDRLAMRRFFKLPEDAFVIGMVANNQGVAPPRKAFPQALMAFKDFHDEHPEAILYLHTDIVGNMRLGHQGVDLRILSAQFGIPDSAIIYTNPMKLLEGMQPGELAALYNCMDVLLNPSYGEGFGVPIVEAQACGVPVVVTDWTSMPELVGAGWKVGGEPFYDCQHYSWFRGPSVPGIVEALEALHAMGEAERDELRANARLFALQYDADRVMEDHWGPVIETLTRPREVKPLANREQRRAAARAKRKQIA